MVVLGSTIWRSGFSLFVLRHFLLLGVGLGLDMKWAGVAKSLGPTIQIIILQIYLLDRTF